jgi:hypothetical protein
MTIGHYTPLRNGPIFGVKPATNRQRITCPFSLSALFELGHVRRFCATFRTDPPEIADSWRKKACTGQFFSTALKSAEGAISRGNNSSLSADPD